MPRRSRPPTSIFYRENWEPGRLGGGERGIRGERALFRKAHLGGRGRNGRKGKYVYYSKRLGLHVLFDHSFEK